MPQPRLALDPAQTRSRRRSRIITTGVAVFAVLASVLTAQTATAAATVFVDDAFDRTVTSGWGVANVGGDYRGTVPAGGLSVGAGVGKFSLGAGQSGSMLLGTATGDDVRSDITLRLDELAGGVYYANLLRYQGDGSHYRARLHFNAAGNPFLGVSRVNGRTETEIKTIKLAETAVKGQTYTLSFSLTGDSPVTIQASLTKVGAAVGAPQLQTTDASASRITTTGRVGWWGYANGGVTGKTTISIDRLTIRDGAAPLTSGAPASTPPPTTTPPTTAPPVTAPPVTAPPVTAPAPDPAPLAPAPSQGRGSATVGSTSYPVPAGAIFVSNSSSQSTQNGAIGTPFKSVQAAVNSASAGSTIVVRGGTYNESVSIPSGKTLTVQAYPKESVWFDGSIPVTNWTASGSVWVASNWTAKFANDMGGAASRFVQASAPMANHPDQIFIDGVAQKQVSSASQVVAGTFAVDYSSKRLILGTNPSGKSVRASNLSQAFDVVAKGSTLQGFGVRRYATTYGAAGAVRLQNTNAVARDLVIVDNALIGLSVGNNDTLVERVTLQRNGQMGFGANAAYRLVLRNSVITNNNVEKFKDAPVAGGVKITRSRDVSVHNIEASNNTGSGIWFDESCWNMKVTNSTANNNTTTGIQLEISGKALLAGNQALGGGTGVIVMNTSDVQIVNNDFGGGTFNGVSLKQDSRRPATSSTGQDPRMKGNDPAMTWLMKNITVSNNAFGTSGDNSIRALDGSTNRAVDTWNLVITGNLFNNKAAGGPTMVAWGKGDNKSFDVYNTPEALAAAKNSSWKNSMTSSEKTLEQMATDRVKYASIATALNSDVAGLLSWPTGTKKVGSAQ